MVNYRLVKIIALKELRSLSSEKTIILAILLQFFIAIFSSFLMVGLSAMYDPSMYGKISGVKYGIGYIGNDTTLLDFFARDQSFLPFIMEPGMALGALKERKLSAVIWVSDTLPGDKDPVTVTVYTIRNDIQSTVVEVKIKEILLEYEKYLREVRSDRLDMKPVTVTPLRPDLGTTFYEFIYGLLIPLLLFMPAIISAGLVIDLITEEKQQQTLDTLRSTTATFEDIICGKIAACIVLIPLQDALWLLLLTINGIRISGLFEILLHVVLASAALILIAAIIALYYMDRTKSQFIFSSAIIVVLLFILAIPANPVNLIVLLSIGGAPVYHWLIMISSLMACLILIITMKKLIVRVDQ